MSHWKLNIIILLSKVQKVEDLSTEVLFLYVQITNVVLSISKDLFNIIINTQCNATIVLRRNLPQESASIKSTIVYVCEHDKIMPNGYKLKHLYDILLFGISSSPPADSLYKNSAIMLTKSGTRKTHQDNNSQSEMCCRFVSY